MMKSFSIICIVITIFISGNAQPYTFPAGDHQTLDAYEDTLALLSYAVIHDSIAENRFAACHQLIPKLVQALKTPNSFQYPFERVQSMSIMYPADSSFRIFTWQLYVDVDEYRYFGAIQMNEPELKLIPLMDRSSDMELIDYEVLKPDNWYGMVYYNIKDFDSPEGRKYLLFGFDGYQFFNKRKMIDVLSFDADGKASFGAPVFLSEGEDPTGILKHRIILEYSAETSIRSNYDDQLEMVIFDHLLPRTSTIKAQGNTFLPDGSYEGYKLKDGHWVHVDKVFHQVLDEPPFPQPILDSRKGKDILGN